MGKGDRWAVVKGECGAWVAFVWWGIFGWGGGVKKGVFGLEMGFLACVRGDGGSGRREELRLCFGGDDVWGAGGEGVFLRWEWGFLRL